MDLSFVVLGLLEEKSRHGYDLKQEYDRRFAHARPLRVGQVYRVLAQLVRDGQVVEVEADSSGGPERRVYAITADGVTDLASWLVEPVEPRPHLEAELFVKVVLSLLSGRPAAEYLDTQRLRHLDRMRDLTTRRRHAPPVEAALLDYELFHIEADLRWIERTASRLADLAAEVGRA